MGSGHQLLKEVASVTTDVARMCVDDGFQIMALEIPLRNSCEPVAISTTTTESLEKQKSPQTDDQFDFRQRTNKQRGIINNISERLTTSQIISLYYFKKASVNID